MSLKIDMHTHIIPKHLPDWSGKFGYGSFIHLDHHRPGPARMMQILGAEHDENMTALAPAPVLAALQHRKPAPSHQG